MSRKGTPYDNACAESFFSTIKLEMIYHEHYITREQAQSAIFEYIEIFITIGSAATLPSAISRRRMHGGAFISNWRHSQQPCDIL
jgi:hypothetical protein